MIGEVSGADDLEVLREAAESRGVKEALHEKGIPEKIVHLLSITTYQLVFMELSKHPRIIDRIRPLIGEDIQLEHSKLASKSPARGKGESHWHQDFAFFPHTSTDLVAVMVMLDDATPENGCMQIARGRHRWGFPDHTVDGYFVEACQEPERWSDPYRIANVEPRPGGISIHHCLVLHGSDPNLPVKPRRGLVFQYRANAYQLADTVFEDTGILVSGICRERVRCDEGVFRLPKRQNPDHLFATAWNQAGPIGREGTHDIGGSEA